MSNQHPIVHIEISAKDREATSKFYQDVFGWEVQDFPEMTYTTFTTGVEPGGGFNPVTAENPAGTVTVYIGADDIEASLGDIESAGGTIIMPKTEIPGMGWFAFFKDPTGNTLALYKTMNPAGA
jgi:predicted enzyme related to lactoylglutathione lyase